MAEFHDIEYQGIGGDQDICVRSERCFRDHSPGYSAITFDHTEKFEGSWLTMRRLNHPVPAFDTLADVLPPWHTQFALLENKSPVPVPENDFVHPYLSRQMYPTAIALSARSIKQRKSLRRGTKPIERYRRETQSHEQLALGMKIHGAEIPDPLLRSSTPEGWPSSRCPDGIYDMPITLIPEPTYQQTQPSQLSLKLQEIDEMVNVISRDDWTTMSPEDQSHHAHHIAMTKRRLRGEESPREHRMPKLRKRCHSVEKIRDRPLRS
ncbi:uncharacterized protein BCR38DRAFT_413720 [Pseudomassariella vexata]|uniref:Uncharacterized protein n=1 Tax=Pseudomassariella vexata TaxID=1141098 RepID=A0A1Y2DEU3_9PEZI|nr:uncharacterized protein BCR38DRAFT_413720 [Pseudomassariella vexata]ORY57812.1 hypothetical protein BCR38DRAFT_413720 [Pseudomassariella vexata]